MHVSYLQPAAGTGASSLPRTEHGTGGEGELHPVTARLFLLPETPEERESVGWELCLTPRTVCEAELCCDGPRLPTLPQVPQRLIERRIPSPPCT